MYILLGLIVVGFSWSFVFINILRKQNGEVDIIIFGKDLEGILSGNIMVFYSFLFKEK